MRRLRCATALALLGLLPAGCLQAPASDQARQIAWLYQAAMVLAAGVFLVVWGLLAWVVLRYRRRAGSDGPRPPQTRSNVRLE